MNARFVSSLFATLALTIAGCAANAGAPEPTADESAAIGGHSACTTDAECQLVDDYCGGCNCVAAPKGASGPKCRASDIVACFAEPCRGQTASCQAGVCVVSSGDSAQ